MSTFEADIWTPGLQSTKAKQSKDTEREWDAGTGPGAAAGSNGATSGVRMGRKSSVSSTASSDEGHGHSVSATLRNSIAGINMKRLGSNRSNKSGKSGPASKDASILYRIFHPGGSSAEPVFGRSRRTYNSGSESEFDSDDSEASVDSNASNLSIGNSNSNMGLSLNPVSRSPMASNQSQGQNKNALRSSVPRISSTKEITSLFDPRAKSKKAPAAVDSESESEAEVDVRKASRPSIFKELLMHKPYSSTAAPANANQQPKKVLSNAPPSAAGSMRALSRSASDDSGDNTSDTDHHSVSSHSSNIFKSIMNGKRKPSVSASAKSASVGLAAKPAAKPVPSKETSTAAAAVKPPSSNSSNTITTTLSASPEAAPGVLASVALPATNANFLSPGVGGGDGKRSNSSGSHTSLDRVGSDLSINEKYGVSGYDKIIGRGASAVVRLCSPINSDKKYAIKEFRSRRKDEKQKEYVKKLIAEFCISSTLDHENIIKTVDLIQDDRKKWCVVMEYAEGGDLYAKIHTGLLTDPDVIDCFFKQLLSGVSYLHSMGVAHRDLKPENLLLDAACRIIKITDFGVSEVFRAPFESHTKKGHGMCGSGPYIAPEEFTQKEYDSELVDVWACGIIYYVMLYNSIPWKSASPSDSRYKHYQEHRGNFWPIDRLAQAKRRLMYRLLDPDPTQRAPMKEVMEDEWVRSIISCHAGMPAEAVPHSHKCLSMRPF
ncbi:serine/threonine-protein kinase HAL4/sat4 [Chytriomyces hyalinus]|nr:serine/threonine-protein kinase HAL4/sat4 [Chytriomyces hyalinus]KAJ3266263.1 serine/threonine-protein kinase HAL4/sat4 [Chytriomyces hyalinus]